MRNLSNIGRIFFGISLAGTGIATIYFNAYPYYLLPPQPFLTPGPAVLHYITGILFILVGSCIVFEKKIRPVSLLFGGLLLLIFCFLLASASFCAAQTQVQESNSNQSKLHFKSVHGNALLPPKDIHEISRLAMDYSVTHHLLKNSVNHYYFVVGLHEKPDCGDCKDAAVYVFDRGHWFSFHRNRHKCIWELDANPDDNTVRVINGPIVYTIGKK